MECSNSANNLVSHKLNKQDNNIIFTSMIRLLLNCFIVAISKHSIMMCMVRSKADLISYADFLGWLVYM